MNTVARAFTLLRRMCQNYLGGSVYTQLGMSNGSRGIFIEPVGRIYVRVEPDRHLVPDHHPGRQEEGDTRIRCWRYGPRPRLGRTDRLGRQKVTHFEGLDANCVKTPYFLQLTREFLGNYQPPFIYAVGEVGHADKVVSAEERQDVCRDGIDRRRLGRVQRQGKHSFLKRFG